jgi:hypothetical protein
MNTALLKLSDKRKDYSGERFFDSNIDDTVLYVYVEQYDCRNTLDTKVCWDTMERCRADIPFPGWIVRKCNLTHEEVSDWIKKHLL